MNIAVVVPNFPGIAQTYLVNQVVGLIELGHQVDVFALEKSPAHVVHWEVIKYGLLENVTYLNPTRHGIRAWLQPGTRGWWRLLGNDASRLARTVGCGQGRNHMRRLLRFAPLLKKPYDVIHCHFGLLAKKVMGLKHLLPHVKFVVTFHGHDIRKGLDEGGQLYRELFDRSDHVLSICNFNAQKLERMGCPPHKLIALPNGVDSQRFKPSGSTSRRRGYRVITTVARLEPVKGIDVGLEVVRELKHRARHNVQYHIIGEGRLREEIEHRLLQLGINDVVVLHGALPQSRVVDRLRESDIYLLPSRAEAFPSVLLEAQAMELPVVAADVGGVREALVQKSSGYLFASEDVAGATRCIERLLEDPPLSARMGRAGRKFVSENFDITELNRKLVEVYAAGLYPNAWPIPR